MIEFEKTAQIKEWLGSGSVNFFGIPFAGKDDQANRLAERFGGEVLSSGLIFRNSVIPPESQAMLDRGEIVPTKDFINIVLPHLSNKSFDGKPLILSSVGRMAGEEEGVVSALEAAHHPLKAVIYLNLEESIIFERLKKANDRGERKDDNIENIPTRIESFKEKTLPVIEYYRKHGLLTEIDASQSREDVERAVLEALANRASASL